MSPVSPLPCCLLPTLNSSICSPSLSLSDRHPRFLPPPPPHSHSPVWQSCAWCHVAATASAPRASASARRVGLALRATRERATPAVKNTASATTGPASASLAGRESTVTWVSCVSARGSVRLFLVKFWLVGWDSKRCHCYNCFLLHNYHLFFPSPSQLLMTWMLWWKVIRLFRIK